MAELGQTIAVFNKSGKVVSTSKHLMSVFKEAKMAYRERKAEIAAERHGRSDERRARKALTALTIDEDSASHTSSRRHHHHRSRSQEPTHRRKHELSARPTAERHHSSSSVRSARSVASHRSRSVASRSNNYRPPSSHSVPTSPVKPSSALTRRHTAQDMAVAPPALQRIPPRRSSSTSAIDMDLAYGSFHPKSLQTASSPTESRELGGLVSKVKVLLEEADCAHASVSAIISHLQKNPEAMAAVALTLAEISNIASKMAPGALTALRTSAPAVFALLASPQFLIAAGVGIGLTVVMFGGFKIVKKIKAAHEASKGPEMDEMVELGSDVSRVETWRRGIMDTNQVSHEANSNNSTLVDGELITPMAVQMKREVASGNKVPMAMPTASSSSMKSKFLDRHLVPRRKSSSSAASGSTSKDKKSKAGSTSSKKSKGKDGKEEKKPSPLRSMLSSF